LAEYSSSEYATMLHSEVLTDILYKKHRLKFFQKVLLGGLQIFFAN